MMSTCQIFLEKSEIKEKKKTYVDQNENTIIGLLTLVNVTNF